jgi:hypothetical protein
MMGKFSDAYSQGGQQAADEAEAQSTAKQVQAAAKKAEFEQGNNWLDQVVRPITAAANAELREQGLVMHWEQASGPPSGVPNVTVNVRKLDAPHGSPLGSISFNVLSGRVNVYIGGGHGNELGTTNDLKSEHIEEVFVDFLRDLGARRPS